MKKKINHDKALSEQLQKKMTADVLDKYMVPARKPRGRSMQGKT